MATKALKSPKDLVRAQSTPIADTCSLPDVTNQATAAQSLLSSLKSPSRKQSITAKGVTKRPSSTKAATGSATDRRKALLDRLASKQLAASLAPLPLTKEEISRKAALQRITSLIGTLELLASTKCTSNSQRKASFTQEELVRYVQDSVRSPVSKDEVVRALELMAGEVTPGYLTRVGKGYWVVNRDEKLREEEVQERLRKAGV